MRKAGIPVEVLVEYVQMYRQGSETKEARMALLRGEYRRLEDRIAKLQAVKSVWPAKLKITMIWKRR